METETLTKARRVRVTLEGEAHALSNSGVLRVRLPEGETIVLDAGWSSVTVEDLPRERTWTPGDVVQGDQLTYCRGERHWYAVTAWGTSFQLDDEGVTDAVDGDYPDEDRLTVLRYQAGEQ